MPQNVSYLKNLALNILKNDTLEVIAKGIEVPELDPCSNCLENYVKDLPQCPKYAIEVEPIDYSKSSSQKNQTLSIPDPMQISPQITSTQSRNTITPDTTFIFNSTLFPDNTKQVQKRSSKDTTKDKSSNKKPKQTKKESHVLNELIKELSTEPETPQTPVVRKENADNFVDLYNNIATAEAQNEITNQKVITCYYLFGKALDNSDDLLQKKKERAQKIYDLFSEIGENKIKRVKSFTALSISKLSQDEIDKILVHFSQKS
ncbi:16782_t:CDS:2 [Gigaspora margarita]|uniref:16782_t:CDS:1 n=1 Tax=Gigaspora margarita TaxID=4874 RepID=A0ABN7VT44_GIGMA|nr:16782_t:CDS:2 [Gigaspora margarita]